MTDLEFVVPGPPQPKERPRLGRRGTVYTPRSTRTYEATVRMHCLAAMGRRAWDRTAGGAYVVEMSVFFPDARRRDLDNACKALLDALNGIAFADDSEVEELHMWRRLDREKPRVEVRVTRLPEALRPPARGATQKGRKPAFMSREIVREREDCASQPRHTRNRPGGKGGA